MIHRPAACLLLPFLLVGCTSLPIMGKRIPHASPTNPAIRCICLWQPSRGPSLDGGGSTRGFAGQILFFTRKSHEPVAVDGDVRIFVFDDHGTRAEQAKPVHEFEYVDGAWNDYLSESHVGAAYNIYVPYTRKTTAEAQCAIRVRLTRPDGSTLFSDLTPVSLDGTRRPNHNPVVDARELDDSYIQHYSLVSEEETDDEQSRFEAWKARAITLGTARNGDVAYAGEPGQLPAPAADVSPVPSDAFDALEDYGPVSTRARRQQPVVQTVRVPDRVRRIGQAPRKRVEDRQTRVERMQDQLQELFGPSTTTIEY